MSEAQPDGVSAEAVLQIGERLVEAPSYNLTSIAFARELDAQLRLAKAVGWVDIAHVLALTEVGLIPAVDARSLISALLELSSGPASFAPSAACGDLYTNREAWLSQRTPAAGWLGVARARREALTTAYHLVLCEELLGLGDALKAFIESVSAKSSRHIESLLPDYTYLQAAQPTTFGHYLQAFAWPALRDLERIVALYDRVDRSPAGIGSMNGSPIAHCRQELSERLGFREPVRHARDAMWQADLAIEAGTIAVMVMINLDRLAEDLMIFATSEFGFVRLADRHTRASKIQPQKRNPFALSFIRAVANRLLGAQTQLAASARTPSAQMDNRLFAYDAAPEALHAAADAARLMSESVVEMEFDKARALEALRDRSVCASDLADRLMVATGADHRRAQGVVGRLLRTFEENGLNLSQTTLDDLRDALRGAGLPLENVTEELLRSALDPTRCVEARSDIGCAAPAEVEAMAEVLSDVARAFRQDFDAKRARRAVSLQQLCAEAANFARGA
jgi:argininosuccinate lyase